MRRTLLLLLFLLSACRPAPRETPPSPISTPTCLPVTATPTCLPVTPAPTSAPTPDKWSLWTNGTQLRGANIWQRIRVPDLDGDLLGADALQ